MNTTKKRTILYLKIYNAILISRKYNDGKEFILFVKLNTHVTSYPYGEKDYKSIIID